MPRINLNRKVRFCCSVSEDEASLIRKSCNDLGLGISDLLRHRLLYPKMLNVDAKQLLTALAHIGNEMAEINSAIKSLDYQNDLKNNQSSHVMYQYNVIQSKLESLLRTLLYRMKNKC